MEDINALTVSVGATIREAMAKIELGARQIALVVDHDNVLMATVTDGDIRRGLLRGLGLDAPVTKVMHTNFTAATEAEGREAARGLMRARGLHQVPIVDAVGRLVDLALVDELPGMVRHNTPVVLMAGGLGTRLLPLTETVPKPMLTVAGKPILEWILRNFIEQGFHDFTISLNYKGNMIRDYFKDGSRFNARISYLEEDKRMGTGGALSLLRARPESPFIVMNGDLLTTIRIDALLKFHQETGALGTMCARDYTMQVPYGVIEVEDTYLKRIVEKPVYSRLVNAGIYALSPGALVHVRPDEFLDMPDLLGRIMDAGARVSVFPVSDYWVDIGRHEDLDRARNDFTNVFAPRPEGSSIDD